MAITLDDARKVGYYFAVKDILEMIEGGGGYVLPAASPSAIGGVKFAASVADIATLTVTGADAAAVATSATTQLAVVTGKLNALLASLRAAGIVQPSA